MKPRQLGWLVLCLLAMNLPALFAEEKADKPESLSEVDPVTKRKLGKSTKAELEILKYTNLARKQHEKPALTAVSHLNVAAQRHAINMARQGKLEHTLDGKTVMDRLESVSYQHRTFAENVAAGYPNEKATVKGWLDSPGHRKNLLDEDNAGYTQIGIGVHRGSDGRWYCCQVFARPIAGKQYE